MSCGFAGLIVLSLTMMSVGAAPAMGGEGIAREADASTTKALGALGPFNKWQSIEITMVGPRSTALGVPNPFSQLVDVVFQSPSGKRYRIPGFYAGDGQGGPDGSIWKTRFSADEAGRWTFRSQSTVSELDGYSGSFLVTPAAENAPDFYRWGRLEYTGTAENRRRYLKFSDGPYWLKAGCDCPENFLGRFQNYDTLTKRKEAIDYLAARGVNSFYIMTHNLDGDDDDVWPWLGRTSEKAKRHGGADARFNIAKLGEWRKLFEYMEITGVVPYIVLEDDSAWTGYDHKRYYREIIAHFGDLPALIFNLGEEFNENYDLVSALGMMSDLAQIDPYDHPRGIHNVNLPTPLYVDSPQVDFTAIQTSDDDQQNRMTIEWHNLCLVRNQRVLVLGHDEPRPVLDRRRWWAGYMAGAVWEVLVPKPYDRPMSAWGTTWTQLGGTRTFMESMPFWEMYPANRLVKSGSGFCLAKPGEVYALYLPNGGDVQVELTQGITYGVWWWNPSNGQDGDFFHAGEIEGGRQQLTAPGSGDWAVKVVRNRGTGNSVPLVFDAAINLAPGAAVPLDLAYVDHDGPGPHRITVTSKIENGTLSGKGSQRRFAAAKDAEGTTEIRWRVNDGIVDSAKATLAIRFTDGNKAPTARHQKVSTARNKAITISLVFRDRDGPGPNRFMIVEPPTHGTLTPDTAGSNDFVYQPSPSFEGNDQFEWRVNDGLADSNLGRVTIAVKLDALGRER